MPSFHPGIHAPDEIVRLYRAGAIGAHADPAARQALADQMGKFAAADIAYEWGLVGAGEGKLSAPALVAMQIFPNCWPGPAQQRGDCVSHGTKNAVLLTAACDIASGQPDEGTGQVEGPPELPAVGITQGVFSSESLYWWRGYNGDGWSGEAGASTAINKGILLRKPYDFADLTRYSGGLAGKYGLQRPPEAIFTEQNLHHVRHVVEVKGFEEARDFLANGYGLAQCSNVCGGSRDESGVSGLHGIGGHCQAITMADDRAETKQKYGEPLLWMQNSWGANWISGGLRILGTQLDAPAGGYWFRASGLRSMSVLAVSSMKGWPPRKLPDWGFNYW